MLAVVAAGVAAGWLPAEASVSGGWYCVVAWISSNPAIDANYTHTK